MKMLDNSIILLTGGSGSLGHAIVEHLYRTCTPHKVIVYSRNEYNQHLMLRKYQHIPWLRFRIGDVRDRERLVWCCRDVDYAIHAAALKRIEVCEQMPLEAVKTNVDGSGNVIKACLENHVKRAVLISTDKAFQPVNLYGATKMTAEKLFLAANNYGRTLFRFIRYGNVIASHGSVVELFLKMKKKNIKKLPITDPEMTRFWWTLGQAAEAVVNAITAPEGCNPVFIPRLPSMRIVDLARTIVPDCEFEVIGMRPGEKLHEGLDEGYCSNTNDKWLSIQEMREILEKEGLLE